MAAAVISFFFEGGGNLTNDNLTVKENHRHKSEERRNLSLTLTVHVTLHSHDLSTHSSDSLVLTASDFRAKSEDTDVPRESREISYCGPSLTYKCDHTLDSLSFCRKRLD